MPRPDDQSMLCKEAEWLGYMKRGKEGNRNGFHEIRKGFHEVVSIT
jgi:hypothetical protein